MIVRASTAVLVVAALAACADGGSDDAGAPLVEDPLRFFATEVVSLTVGEGGGFHKSDVDDVVTGPPEGAGELAGSLDVVSLGHQGALIVKLGQDVIDVDGADLLVFENAFVSGPRTFVEAVEVALSDDGETWHTFACTADAPAPNGCAGFSPVYANSEENDVDPRDPAVAGGDAFDLADVGLASARYVRLVDVSDEPGDAGFDTGGADIDAVAIVNGAARDER